MSCCLLPGWIAFLSFSVLAVGHSWEEQSCPALCSPATPQQGRQDEDGQRWHPPWETLHGKVPATRWGSCWPLGGERGGWNELTPWAKTGWGEISSKDYIHKNSGNWVSYLAEPPWHFQAHCLLMMISMHKPGVPRLPLITFVVDFHWGKLQS